MRKVAIQFERATVTQCVAIGKLRPEGKLIPQALTLRIGASVRSASSESNVGIVLQLSVAAASAWIIARRFEPGSMFILAVALEYEWRSGALEWGAKTRVGPEEENECNGIYSARKMLLPAVPAVPAVTALNSIEQQTQRDVFFAWLEDFIAWV